MFATVGYLPGRSSTPALVRSLQPEPQPQEIVVRSCQEALVPIFLYPTPVFLIGVVTAFLLPEKPSADGDDRHAANADGNVKKLTPAL
ncbi:hypothetical protein [Actinocorallia libanotica]|uniref:Uncharacterized protein n=1 Tax=Actinocorallia libanotica TaxID=46162 RepID=A0ABP4BGG6_9ACTN